MIEILLRVAPEDMGLVASDLTSIGQKLAKSQREREAAYYVNQPRADPTQTELPLAVTDTKLEAAEEVVAEVVETQPAPAPETAPPGETVKRRPRRKQQPESPAVVGEIKPAEVPAVGVPAVVVPAAEAPKVDTLSLVKDHAKKCGMVAAVKALADFGATKLSGVPADKLPEFIARLQAELKASA